MSTTSRKSYYTEKALAVMKQDGLRLSLEEIAAKMGVTKKTIYNHFESKDELLKECILQISQELQSAFQDLDSKEQTAIDNLHQCFVKIDEIFVVLSPIFFYDIMHLSINQAMSEHFIGFELFKTKMTANLKQGIATGLYRADLDVELVSSYMTYSIVGFYINNIVKNNPSISKSYFTDIVEFNLRAMVSEKGRAML